MNERSNEIYRIDVGEYFGFAAGYLIPEHRRERFCDDAYTVGRYRIVVDNPPRYRWTGGPELDVVSAIGPVAANEKALEVFHSIEPTVDSTELAVVAPKGEAGRRIERRYRLVCPEYEATPLSSSTVQGGAICPKCGRAGPVQVLGVEVTGGQGSGDAMPTVTLKPRLLGAGLHVSTRALVGRAIFTWRGMVFCTTEARRILEASELTNIAFRAYGECIDDPAGPTP